MIDSEKIREKKTETGPLRPIHKTAMRGSEKNRLVINTKWNPVFSGKENDQSQCFLYILTND